VSNKVKRLEPRPTVAQIDTPTDLSEEAVREISAALNALLADTFALYVKDQELPLARHRTAFPRLSPSPR
jgi:hypothetical protein